MLAIGAAGAGAYAPNLGMLRTQHSHTNAYAAPCAAGEVPWPDEPCQPARAAAAAASDFLRANLPAFDKPNEATLFDGGLVGPTVNLSLTARQRFGWAARVPRAVWQDAVLPFASANEARTDWRQLLWRELLPIVGGLSNSSSLATVALAVNAHAWAALGRFSGTAAVTFRSEQTPLLFDPMSTLLYGYASCTGISLLYVDLLRTVGIPARLAGTPAWHGRPQDGNHNWVEVWLGPSTSAEQDLTGGWAFMEGAPAGGGEGFARPCDKWFCSKARFGVTSGPNRTRVFATAYDRAMAGGVSYPMAWDLANDDIAGVERTALYEQACGSCP